MTSLPVKMGLAIRRLDAELEQAPGRYEDELPVTHLAVLQGWELRLRSVRGVLIRYPPDEFGSLGATEKQIEVNRAQAEALLAVSRAGELSLDKEEEERLFWRAAGILPSDEPERLVEIASCHELGPHFMTSSPERFVAGVEKVEKLFGQASALSYGFLLMAGVRSVADLVKYGTRIQRFFNDLTNRPSVMRMLLGAEEAGIKSLTHGEREQMLRTLRGQLWLQCPRRVGLPFLLTQVIDGCLGLRPGGIGDSLGLAVLDSIVVGKMGFPVSYRVRQGRFYLEIAFSIKGVEHWDPMDQKGKVPLSTARRASLLDLFTEGYLRLARGYVTTKSFANGVRVAEWVLKLKPDLAEAYQILGECLLGLDRPSDAIEASKKALELDCRLADAYMVLGNCCTMQEDWKSAVDHYRKAIGLRVGYAEAYNNLGLALSRDGQAERALGAYNEATRIREDYIEAHYNMGNLLLELGRLDEAIEAYRTAVGCAPRFAGAHYNLGQAFYKKGNLAEALAAYQEAVKVNPKHAGAWNNLGIVYRDMGEEEKAVEALEKAVELNPNLLR